MLKRLCYALLILAPTACGGGASALPPQVPVLSVQAILDARGGILEIGDPDSPGFGAGLEVPAGALRGSAAISIEYVPGDEPVLILEPSGLQFATPVRASVPAAEGQRWPSDATLVVVGEDGFFSILSAQQLSVDGRILSGETSHFSLCKIALRSQTGTNTAQLSLRPTQGFRLPIGDVDLVGGPDDFPDYGRELGRVSITLGAEMLYPKIRLDTGDERTDWWVKTAHAERYNLLSSDSDSLECYADLERGETCDERGYHHQGEDWNRVGADDAGSPVFAIARGTVLFAGPSGSFGNLVLLAHFLPCEEVIVSAYAHLASMQVSATEEVEKGTVIGGIGETGSGSGGPHLHFEVARALEGPSAASVRIDQNGECTLVRVNPSYGVWPVQRAASRLADYFYSPTQFILDRTLPGYSVASPGISYKTWGTGSSTIQERIAQKITMQSDMTLTRVRHRLKKWNQPGDRVFVRIVEGGGSPDGGTQLVDSLHVAGEDISAGNGYVDFLVDSLALKNGTTYWFVFSRTEVNASNFYQSAEVPSRFGYSEAWWHIRSEGGWLSLNNREWVIELYSDCE